MWVGGFLVGTAVVLLRVTASGASVNSLWAEDGSIFLAQSRTDGVASVGHTYAGYLHVLPRSLALVTAEVPLRWSPLAVTVLAAMTLSAMALVATYAVSGHVRHPVLRILLCVYVVLLPAGPETIGSIANLHWTLLFLAVCVLLWDPATRVGRTLSCAVLFVAATSNPLGLVLVPLALVRLAALGRRAAPQLVALSVGAGLQSLAMVSSGGRDTAPFAQPFRIGVWYVGDVLPTAVFGSALTQRSDPGVSPVSAALGIVVLVVLVGAALVLRQEGPRRARPVALICLAYSVLLYASLASLAGMAPGRYSVPAVLLLLLAGLVVLDAVLDSRRLRQAWKAGGASRVGLALVAVVGVGLATSVPALPARSAGPAWEREVKRAQSDCTDAPGEGASLRIPPGDTWTDTTWTVDLPCEAVT